MDKLLPHDVQAALVLMDAIYLKNDNSPIAKTKQPGQKYAGLVSVFHDILLNKLSGDPPDDVRKMPFTTLFSIVEMILCSIVKSPEIMLEAIKPRYSGEALVCHSLNVAFFSIKVGLQMGLPVKDLCELGVAGLLHDIGMTKIDVSNFSHERELSKKEQRAVEMHPTIGSKFFENLRNDFPWLLSVILEEHKRENHQGYPDGIMGELHCFSKIVGICDSYEALSHERPFRKPFHPADAMKAIIAEKGTLYDKEILRSVIESLGIYPVGSIVKLNNNRIATVVQTVPGSPLRPIVNAYEEGFSDVEPVRVDLSKDSTLYVSGLSYSDDYIQPTPPA